MMFSKSIYNLNKKKTTQSKKTNTAAHMLATKASAQNFTAKPLVIALSMLLPLSLLGGCSSNPKRTSGTYDQYNKVRSQYDTSDTDNLEELLSATDMNAVESNRMDVLRYGDMWQRIRAGFGMNLTRDNQRIEAQKSWFIARQPYINRLSARASRYLYYTVAEAERRGIPTELALLPVIESSYDPTATSNAAAAGMWQFIPSTGRIYGLRQTGSYDGRRDVIESTRAAYDFLTSLYNKFGSWELALAAYNCGPGCVNKAIKKNRRRGRATDYWSLKLPKETMHYVPRFLAVAKIVKNPDQYGMNLPSIANRPHFRSVPIQGGIALSDVSRLTGVSTDTLYDLNPALIAGQTDIEGPNRLLVPTSMPYRYDEKISQLSGYGYSAVSTLNQSDTTLSVKTLDSAEAANLMAQGGLGKRSNRDSSSQDNSNQDSYASARAAFYNAERKKLPKSSRGLAEFAASARVPNQTISYIQPKVTVPVPAPLVAQSTKKETKKTVTNVTPQSKAQLNNSATSLQPVTETKKQKLQTQVLADINSLPTSAAQVTKNETVVQYPRLSSQERAQVVAEIKKADPTVKDVIDPLDGEIKLDAIQTQQSILAAQGKEKKLTFETPVKKPKKVTKPAKKAKDKRVVYKVKSGDTLKKIGERFGVSWRDIANWNQIDPSKSLYVGTPLYLYGAKEAKPVAKPTSYRVQSGDTMIGVANKFNMSASELAKLNDMNALDNLIIGQKLTLVASQKTSSTKLQQTAKSNKNDAKKAQPTTRKSTSQKTKIYRVQAGEGLIQLAKRFGMSTAELAKLNGISPTKNLYVGQRMKVPTTAETRPASYTVKSGDTMIGVAKQFDLSASQLAKRNGLKALDNLRVGQRLTLLENKADVKSARSNKTTSNNVKNKVQAKEKSTSYTVESGDTMIYVARKFKLSTNKLAKWNGLKPTDDLRIGQKLTLVETAKATGKKVKKKTEQVNKSKSKKRAEKPTSYKVESGDTMIYVARKFKLSTNNLAKWNGMKPTDNLRIGQKLTLVSKGEANKRSVKSANKKSATKTDKRKSKYTSYKIKSGDGLIALARKHGISTAALAKLNNMKPTDSLQLGKTIKVPVN